MRPSDDLISAIVLAAGLSRRMGKQNKMLYCVDEKPMLKTVLEQLLATQIPEIIVVVGHEHYLVKKIIPIDARIKIVFNSDYGLGMSTSISAGAKALTETSKAVLICLGDMPYLTTEDYQTIIDHTPSDGVPSIIIPKYKETKGHPVLFTTHFFDDLANLKPSDKGARSVVNNNVNLVSQVSFKNDHVLIDVDLPRKKGEVI